MCFSRLSFLDSAPARNHTHTQSAVFMGARKLKPRPAGAGCGQHLRQRAFVCFTEDPSEGRTDEHRRFRFEDCSSCTLWPNGEGGPGL